jgi:hypothetical protein
MKFLLTYPIRIGFAALVTSLTLAWSVLMFLWYLWEIPPCYNLFKGDCWEYNDNIGIVSGHPYKSVWHWCFYIR